MDHTHAKYCKKYLIYIRISVWISYIAGKFSVDFFFPSLFLLFEPSGDS